MWHRVWQSRRLRHRWPEPERVRLALQTVAGADWTLLFVDEQGGCLKVLLTQIALGQGRTHDRNAKPAGPLAMPCARGNLGAL